MHLTAFLVTLSSAKHKRHLHFLPDADKVLVADTLCGDKFLAERLKIFRNTG